MADGSGCWMSGSVYSVFVFQGQNSSARAIAPQRCVVNLIASHAIRVVEIVILQVAV